jgi:hypothetical protein
MIGVVADPLDHEVVQEFFELFKTPWDFHRSGTRYDVVLNCTGGALNIEAGQKLSISYVSRKIEPIRQHCGGSVLQYRGRGIPIYGDCEVFPESGGAFLKSEDLQMCAGYIEDATEPMEARIGYNLFHEIRHLLTIGQPAKNASIPTLELHIALLRDLIVQSGVALTEIPPVPDGYTFIACLTHDVDHPSIRQHKFDHTAVGFFYRATIGSVRKFVRGRMPLRNLLNNWTAALKLPFVYIGVATDFWRSFDSQYVEVEEGVPSTFFVIPFKNRPGQIANRPASQFRAAQYGAQDVADKIAHLCSVGCEIGLHGIDAWRDSKSGTDEIEEIRHFTDQKEIGVRMHWLYFDKRSPQALESAGVAYDSTVGYNETVGYRAGTTQVFKLLGTQNLLELPLHIMDTALFNPAHMGLTDVDSKKLTGEILDNAVEFGGCVTVNWHDRSLAPERLWGRAYRDLLKELKNRGAWITTASQVVLWFRERRHVTFDSSALIPTSASSSNPLIPSLRVSVKKAKARGNGLREQRDTNLDEAMQSGRLSSADA